MIVQDEIHFCEDFASKFSGIAQLLSEHVAYFDEILPHVFMGDVTRYVHTLPPDRASIVQFLEDVFPSGNKAVEELIAVSFIENIETREDLCRILAGVNSQRLTEEWKRQHSA
jgi:hypothetical protein